MACPECARLLAESEDLNRAHIAAFDAMIEATTGPAADFINFKVAANKAFVNAERARLELEQHKRVHVKAN